MYCLATGYKQYTKTEKRTSSYDVKKKRMKKISRNVPWSFVSLTVFTEGIGNNKLLTDTTSCL